MLELILIITGLLGLWFGTELVVDGAVKIAQHYRLSELFVGLTILSIGSDLPELAVAIDAGIRDLAGTETSGTVVGTSIGSTFGQIGLVLGITGLISTLSLAHHSIYRQGTALLASIVILFATAWDGHITQLDGFFLIAAYAAYFAMLILSEKRSDVTGDNTSINPPYTWLSLIAGMFIVIASSDITVYNAVNLATSMNVSQTTIAILIIGPGTSLPELVISLNALFKKKHHLSVGNIIGSNIFDTLIPIGAAAMISSIDFDSDILDIDLPLLFLLTMLVLFLFRFRDGIQRIEAMLILLFYASYVAVVSSRLT